MFSIFVKTQESRNKMQGSGLFPGMDLKIESCVLNLESFLIFSVKIQESRNKTQGSGFVPRNGLEN
jgi:hypothetical protein